MTIPSIKATSARDYNQCWISGLSAVNDYDDNEFLIDPAKGAESDAVAVVESWTLRSQRRVPVPAVNTVNEDFFETRRLKDNFAFKSTFTLNVVCTCMSCQHI